VNDELDIYDLAIIGNCVKRFTDIENDFKKFGHHMDELISAEDTKSVMEYVSSIYLTINSLLGSTLGQFIAEINDYLNIKQKDEAD